MLLFGCVTSCVLCAEFGWNVRRGCGIGQNRIPVYLLRRTARVGTWHTQSTRWKLTYRIQSTLSAPLLWWCPDREDVSCRIKGWGSHIFDSSHIINMLGIAYVWFGIYIWQQICTKLVVCPFFPEKWKHCDCSFLKWNCFASKTHENPLWRFTCVGSGTSDKLYKSNDLI